MLFLFLTCGGAGEPFFLAKKKPLGKKEHGTVKRAGLRRAIFLQEKRLRKKSSWTPSGLEPLCLWHLVTNPYEGSKALFLFEKREPAPRKKLLAVREIPFPRIL